MVFKEEKGKLYVFEKGELRVYIENWRKYKRFYGGKIIENKFSDFSEFLEVIPKEFKKSYPRHSLILNLGKVINNKLNSNGYTILKRNFMVIELGNFTEKNGNKCRTIKI
ncbi:MULTISPECIES: hypothetical protein [unclassified Thermosipho (in: thermotogales)]|uniref:hypothetical protein n=1 Tax=unclassified Thermosipho (in: thermotogales) TaxID=2676525 RepID=UPI000985E75B|nr:MULTISPECIES: hypothetical protein [unclassified Thermosipho (in: thermotogales)]MBT1247870.1 hypothetical protein [Thermosipho sp. 1244]OOC45436.1 hypothetical protein XO09_08640 [Thermosipho sp. 1223]